MALITDYASLKTEVANWAARNDLTADIPLMISLAEQRIYRELRVTEMETALDETIASGVIAIPDGYLEAKKFYVDGSPTRALERMTLDQLYEKYPLRSASGKPVFFAEEGGNFIFGPYPDDDYTIKGVYYKKLDALSEANDTNWLITKFFDGLLFGAMAETWLFVRNETEAVKYDALFERAKRAFQRADNNRRMSGSTLRVKPS